MTSAEITGMIIPQLKVKKTSNRRGAISTPQ